MSGGKTAGFHLAVKRRPREWDQGEHLLYAQHRPNLSGSRVLFTFVCVDHSPSCPQRSRSGHPATRRATRTCVFANPENVGRVDHPEHHAQARPKWNGGCKLIVRLGATAHKKERSCPRFDCRIFRRWGRSRRIRSALRRDQISMNPSSPPLPVTSELIDVGAASFLTPRLDPCSPGVLWPRPTRRAAIRNHATSLAKSRLFRR